LQKPGLLNLKPFKNHKPDIMTVKYVDTLIEQYSERLKKIELERMERAKKERADIQAYLNRPLLSSIEELREGIEEDNK
jgi:Asp-tRNA(Asn)/Glu-tRNA(Gln) amidotransferase B subunit